MVETASVGRIKKDKPARPRNWHEEYYTMRDGLRDAIKLLEGLQCENCSGRLSEAPSPDLCHPDVGHAEVTAKIRELKQLLADGEAREPQPEYPPKPKEIRFGGSGHCPRCHCYHPAGPCENFWGSSEYLGPWRSPAPVFPLQISRVIGALQKADL